MASNNPFSQLVSGLKSPTYTGLNLDKYAYPTGGMSKAPTQYNMTSAITKKPAVGTTTAPNSNGATSPQPTKITPPTSSPASYRGVAITPGNEAAQLAAIDRQFSSSPAANQYISMQLQPEPYLGSTTQKRTLKPDEDRMASSARPQQNTAYSEAMKAYLQALQGSQDINARVQEQTLAGNRSYQGLLDKTGGLLPGNQQAAAMDARRTNASLADLGIAQTSATNAANLALQRLQFEQDLLPSRDPYTLSPGQIRYDAQGNIIAAAPSDAYDPFTLSEGQTRYAFNPDTGTYEVVGSAQTFGQDFAGDPAVGAWAELVSSDPARLAQVPENLRNAVVLAVQGLPATANPEVQKAVQDATLVLGVGGQGGLINDALTLVSPTTTGLGALASFVPGTPGYDLNSLVDTIRAKLGFQELQAMRAASPTGGALGQVTERELNFLQSAVANLDTKQSEKQLRKNLEKVRDHYQNWVNAVTQANQSVSGGGGYTGTGAGGLYDF